MMPHAFGALRAVLPVAALAAAALAPARPTAAQQTAPAKIAVVDGRAILRQTPGYAQAESTFNREFAAFQDEIRRLQTQFDSAMTAFEQQSIGLTPAARQARQRELRDMEQRFEQRSNELRTRAESREQELLAPLQTRVNQVIQGIRAEGNYTLILDVSTPGSAVVAVDPAIDLTQRVLDRLRSAP